MSLREFFHRKAPADSLALYRIGLGTVIALEVCTWLPHAVELFSNEGFHIPNWAALPAPPPWAAYLLCLALILSAASFAAGFFTRTSAAATLLLWSYTYGLDSINEKAAQTIVIIVLTMLTFSSCGHRYSVDAYLRRKRGLKAYPATTSVFIQRLLQIEFAQIYFFSGIAKMTNYEWVNGSTFYRMLNGRWATELGVFISALDLNFLARLGGLGTILFELFMGLMLFTPALRPFAILLGVAFHSGIQLTLWIGTLGIHFIMALVLLFPEPETVATYGRKILGRK